MTGSDPGTVDNPFFHLAPQVPPLPLVILATVATVIASQAVISGAFSVTVQAIRLGLLPRLMVRHTSHHEGQVYLPTVDGVLFAGVMILVLAFGSSAELASAYGLAVTGTLVLESGIFLVFALAVWRWRWWAAVLYVAVIGVLELVLLAANSTKIIAGGWIPLLVAVLVLAAGVPHVRPAHRIEVRNLDSTADGIVHVTVKAGFLDRQDIPRNLALVVKDAPELDIDLDAAHYFISVLSLLPPQEHPFRSWPQRLFLALERNQAGRTEVFHLPPMRTVVMGSELET